MSGELVGFVGIGNAGRPMARHLAAAGYELLAYDYYQRSDEKRSATYLASANKVPFKGDRRELEHNQEVIDMLSGKTPQAERAFAKLTSLYAGALK